MTDPSVPPGSPGPPRPPGLSSRSRTILFFALSLVGLILLIVAFSVTLSGRTGSVDLKADLAAGSTLSVQLPNADIDLRQSPDDEVHVTMTGTFFGNRPTLTATTEGGVTEVRGGCRAALFSRCSVTVTVALPRDLPATVDGENGRITAVGLSGRLNLGTTNGAIETTGSVGRTELRSTNGAIRVTDATAKTVSAATTNGAISLQFADAPEDVTATSTNGGITVRVPDDGVTYRVTAQTTNGSVERDSVPSDSTSRRSITALTTNGGITVQAID